MQTLTFKYTKETGDISERTLVTTIVPSDKFAGIDVTMLEPQDAAQFAKLAIQLHDKYLMDLKELQRAFDLTHNYRQFLSSGVSELSKI